MPLSIWLAVLAEVKQQVAHAAKEESKANGSWVDLAEDTSASPSHEKVTQRWQQQQWQNAFEVLVCPSDVAREFAQAQLSRSDRSSCSLMCLLSGFCRSLRHHLHQYQLRNRMTCFSLYTWKRTRYTLQLTYGMSRALLCSLMPTRDLRSKTVVRRPQ